MSSLLYILIVYSNTKASAHQLCLHSTNANKVAAGSLALKWHRENTETANVCTLIDPTSCKGEKETIVNLLFAIALKLLGFIRQKMVF